MTQFKICLIGAFAVGKTSLVAKFVRGIFSEKYLATLGVKIDRKLVTASGREVKLILWDMAGEDEFSKISASYLRGANGYILVIDGTRPSTLEQARVLEERIREALGPVPFIALLNKCDLEADWALSETECHALAGQGWLVQRTSAKTGEGVEASFQALTAAILKQQGHG